MSVEKLKCPKSHPVLTFSRLKYSETVSSQEAPRKSSVLFQGFDPDQTYAEYLGCAHPCWFSEPKSAKPDCSKWGFCSICSFWKKKGYGQPLHLSSGKSTEDMSCKRVLIYLESHPLFTFDLKLGFEMVLGQALLYSRFPKTSTSLEIWRELQETPNLCCWVWGFGIYSLWP